MANLYNTTLIVNSDEASGRFMDVGVHENVELTKIEYNVSKNGNKFIAFYFENADGQTLSHTEWEPNANTDKELEVKVINQMARIEQIATKFVDKTKLNINASDFESYCKNIVRILTGTFTGIKLRIKAVYNGKLVGLPGNYGIIKKDGTPRGMIQFIERMDAVPTEKSKIKLISSLDTTVKPQPTPTVGTTTNPFEVDATSPF